MTRAQLRGRGYQKKGGQQATALHNERVRAAAPAVQPDPTPDAARTRASAGVSWPLIASAWIAGLGMGGTTVALVELAVLR